jgi:ABC-2 type transport system ATP-binding protein
MDASGKSGRIAPAESTASSPRTASGRHQRTNASPRIFQPQNEGGSRNSTVPFAAPSPPKLVEAVRLRKCYGNHLAVKEVSFSIEPGEILGLLGPNGAGKSTTMMMIAGLLPPTSGSILFEGREFTNRNLQQRRLLGVVPQEYAIYQELNAIDNLLFFGRLYGLRGKELKSRCDNILEQIGLTEAARRQSGTYSGGMKRRLNFGVALMHKPKILILDEPTVGVDPQSRSHLMDCVRTQASEGVGIIYASHYMEEVQSICQRVAIVDRGEVLAYDSISNLLDGIASDLYLYVDRTTGITNELSELGRLGIGSDGEPAIIIPGELPSEHQQRDVMPLRYGTGTLGVDVGRSRPELSWRLQAALFKLGNLGVRVLRVETQQSNLERLFLQLTGKRLRD